MTYTEIWPALLSGQDRIFELAREGGVRRILVINLTILGLLFGLSNLAGLLPLDPDLPTGSVALLIVLLLVLGIFYMLVALSALCLIYWAAAKAFGGQGGFGLSMDLIGVCTPAFWVLAPLLNYTLRFSQPGTVTLLLIVPLVLSFFWSFRLIRQSLVVGQGLPPGKATVATACMWIFSVSSIYVFTP